MSKRKLSDTQIDEICRRYKAGESSYKLATDFGVSAGTIVRQLVDRGIPRRGCGGQRRKHQVNDQYFKQINTEDRGYWLGFVSADGHVGRDELRIHLQARDRGHLLKLLKALDSDYPVHGHTKPSKDSREQLSYARIQIASAALASDLRGHGVVVNKGLTLRWPPAIPKELWRHYVRGFVDANGGFSIWQSRTGHRALRFYVTSNRDFLLGLQGFLMKACQLKRTKLNPTHWADGYICALEYTGNRQVNRIWHFLYDNATVWLDRKRNKVEKHILEWEYRYGA